MADRRNNLLIEIGTEELPPKALSKLARSLAAECTASLVDIQLVQELPVYRWYATPRRLAVWVEDVKLRQPDQIVERRGPAVKVAFDAEGHPTRAALGFARSCGVDVGTLMRTETDKGEWLVFKEEQPGKPADVLIPDCIEQSIRQLPIPKRMRWGTLDVEFVRPVHWLVVLHGKKLIKTKLLSVDSGRCTMGHRFHCQGPLKLAHADDYEKTLMESGKVIADFDQRKQRVFKQINALARAKGGVAAADEDLLQQVTGLVEWPQALIGGFDPRFLKLPGEVLVSSMRDHQKYFHVSDQDGNLLPYFLTVSNIESKSPKRIRQGNERVLRARLADAQFFWDTDRKITLAEHSEKLDQVTFHEKLGSVADKSNRLQSMARVVAPLCNIDAGLCARAAHLVKADLVTDMVSEFPDLQGIMGHYYARHDGEDDEVAMACADHYKPRFAGDELPGSPVGLVIALIDRLDSLLGLFAAGEEPSGDKDPYALRRSALGILRLLIEGRLDLDLAELLDEAVRVYQADDSVKADPTSQTVGRVLTFIEDRLQAYYSERGFGADEIAAVNATKPTRPSDFDRRLRAVSKFRQLDAANNLAAANKRIRNILKKAGNSETVVFDIALVTEPAERELADTLQEVGRSARACFETAQYEAGLDQLASLKEPVDRFFNDVMVMDENELIRRNRLALLQELQDLFLQVADISHLQEAG